MRRNTLPASTENDRLGSSDPDSGAGMLERAARESDPGHDVGLQRHRLGRRMASSQLPPRDAVAAVRALQAAPHFAGAPDSVPAQATLGSLASMLMACSVLQVRALGRAPPVGPSLRPRAHALLRMRRRREMALSRLL